MRNGIVSGQQRGLARRWAYRASQFFAAVLGRVSDEEMVEACEVLGPGLYQVFAAMPGQYRLHMLKVYGRVRAGGCDDLDVWQAALLHDSGKYDPASGRYVSVPYRIAVVLIVAAPRGKSLLMRLATPAASEVNDPAGRMGWRYPFYLHRHHAELGAARAKECGASQDVVRLIACHHKHGSPDRALAALQAADEQS